MKKTLIIAEAGVNHNGSLELAKELAKAAKEANADMVKFQTFVPEMCVSKFAEKAEYQQKNDPNTSSQLDMIRELWLSEEEFIELKEYCDKIKIKFLSTPFDFHSIEFLKKLNMPAWKVPSGEITNLPYLERIARTKQPVIMSTGMSDIEEVRTALKILRDNGTSEISLMQCTTQYPAPMDELNLKAMQTLRSEFGVPVGFSDHTIGIEAAIAAVAMGAEIVEKHFTLSKNMEGPDHAASLEPHELRKMISSIRNVELAMGHSNKIATNCEIPNKSVARKSIVALKNIKKGEIFSEENITVKRPGNGISPMRWYDIIGSTAIRDFAEDELIEV